VRSVGDVHAGDGLSVRVSDGSFAARVESTAGGKRSRKRVEKPLQPTLFPNDARSE